MSRHVQQKCVSPRLLSPKLYNNKMNFNLRNGFWGFKENALGCRPHGKIHEIL